MKHHLLPVKHYHVIFTIPHELNDLVFHNRKLLFNLLFKSVWQSIEKILGSGKTGMVATLHSWGSNLSRHPHIHCIVPDGKLIDNEWLRVSASNQQFYCNATELRETFKEIFIQNLTALLENEALKAPSHTAATDFAYYTKLLKTINGKKWNVRIEASILGVQQIIEYLGRYVRRVAFTNSRIKELSDTHVGLSYKQYSKQKQGQPAPEATMRFNPISFLKCFVQHILPAYFHRVRYFGLYAFAAKRKKQQAFECITGNPIPAYQPPLKRQLIQKMLGVDPDVCPGCACYQTLQSKQLDATDKFYFQLPKWHNIRIKLRQEQLSFEQLSFVA